MTTNLPDEDYAARCADRAFELTAEIKRRTGEYVFVDVESDSDGLLWGRTAGVRHSLGRDHSCVINFVANELAKTGDDPWHTSSKEVLGFVRGKIYADCMTDADEISEFIRQIEVGPHHWTADYVAYRDAVG